MSTFSAEFQQVIHILIHIILLLIHEGDPVLCGGHQRVGGTRCLINGQPVGNPLRFHPVCTEVEEGGLGHGRQGLMGALYHNIRPAAYGTFRKSLVKMHVGTVGFVNNQNRGGIIIPTDIIGICIPRTCLRIQKVCLQNVFHRTDIRHHPLISGRGENHGPDIRILPEHRCKLLPLGLSCIQQDIIGQTLPGIEI